MKKATLKQELKRTTNIYNLSKILSQIAMEKKLKSYFIETDCVDEDDNDIIWLRNGLNGKIIATITL